MTFRAGRLARALIVAGAPLLLGAACTERKPPPGTQAAGLKLVEIPIEGMSCSACAARVKKSLSSIDGVAGVEVDLAGRKARVRFEPGRVAQDRLVSAVNGLGYRAGSPAEAR
jgi:copper chaperone CopZ